MVNSADPAARWVWPTLTSRHVTGAVNLIKIPSHDPKREIHMKLKLAHKIEASLRYTMNKIGKKPDI